MRVFAFLFSLLFLFSKSYSSEELTSPPPNLPVPVKMHVHFLNFNSLDEKDERFNADFYFVFKWQDPRLSYEPNENTKMKVFFDKGATDKLKTIWWPQIEYLNIKKFHLNNQTLFIFPDGQVHLYVSMEGDFYSAFNLKRFPFDTQVLYVNISSFLWSDNILYFEIEQPITYDSTVNTDQDEFKILNISENIIKKSGLKIEYFGTPGEFSVYQISITLKREWYFVVSQVFLPLILTIFICCLVFLGFKESFLDQIMLILTCSLVVVAIKFTIDSYLPTIAYLTVIDQAFTISYFFFTFCVFACILEKHFLASNPELSRKINLVFIWLIPLLFILSIVTLILLSG